MTRETTTSAKRGRKPLGETAMSPAERKRRSRELLRASGAKEFSLKLQGLHLDYVERLAAQSNTTTAETLRDILESALDRYVAVLIHCERMLDHGATDEEAAHFMSTYWMPALPPMPEARECFATEPKLAEGRDALTIMGLEVK
jgi:hypothetical protein